jgi:hypothetical protein
MAELFPLSTRTLAASVLTGLVMLGYSLASLVAMPLVCTVQLGLLLFYVGGNLLMLVGGAAARCVGRTFVSSALELHAYAAACCMRMQLAL